MGEYLLRKMAPNRFETFSAGASPSGKVNPLVLRCLKETFQMDAADARSKSWEEFKSVHFDFVITVCDHAREICPVWPGQPIIAHWSSPDPANFEGTDEEKLKKIKDVAFQIRRRLELFNCLPLEKMESLKLAFAVKEIGSREQIMEKVAS